jgi:hypothetical protein
MNFYRHKTKLCTRLCSTFTSLIADINANKLVIDAGINGAWSQYDGKITTEKTVWIKNAGDIHPYSYEVAPPQFKCKTVIIEHCNKNFVYYWLTPFHFIGVKNIVLFSHPCEPVVFRRWPSTNIFLSKQYANYKRRWADDMDNVMIVDYYSVPTFCILS